MNLIALIGWILALGFFLESCRDRKTARESIETVQAVYETNESLIKQVNGWRDLYNNRTTGG